MDKRRLSTKNMVYYAILMALNVVLTRVGSIRIGGGGVELVRMIWRISYNICRNSIWTISRRNIGTIEI